MRFDLVVQSSELSSVFYFHAVLLHIVSNCFGQENALEAEVNFTRFPSVLSVTVQ